MPDTSAPATTVMSAVEPSYSQASTVVPISDAPQVGAAPESMSVAAPVREITMIVHEHHWQASDVRASAPGITRVPVAAPAPDVSSEPSHVEQALTLAWSMPSDLRVLAMPRPLIAL